MNLLSPMTRAVRSPRRGAALLAFAGPPPPAVLVTMTACATNLDRRLSAITTGTRRGGVLVTDLDVAKVVAAVRRRAIAVVVVAGGTTPRVVRRLAMLTQRPVLVARTRTPWRRVLAATDLRGPGAPVLALATSLAAERDAEAFVLHSVAPSWATPALAIRPLASAAVVRRMRRLARLAVRATPRPRVLLASAVQPARAIVEAMTTHAAELVVVGMRRARAGVGCAERVVADAAGNVLVVPLAPPAAAWGARS
ncbi:MAG: universal stress protein [Myxococcales bacterium]|nr:universal stress protein [Myxococcales bacterium]